MTLRRLTSITAFPVTFLVTHALALRAIGAGADPTAVIAGITAASVALVVVLERLVPFDPDWNRARGDVVADVLHNLFSTVVTAQVCQALLLVALAPLAAWLATRTGESWWPSAWPLTAQTALAFVISELGAYWAHRVGHESDLGWRLHSVHHSPTRLYWLNAARDNPLGVVLLYVPSVAPLVVMGAPREMFAMVALFNAVVGLFQHANVDIRLGPLNYLFSVLEVHRWHHSTVVAEANHNYGSNLMIFDVLFGTVYWPRDRPAPDAIGIASVPDFPTDYWGHLAVPFRWRAIVAARATER